MRTANLRIVELENESKSSAEKYEELQAEVEDLRKKLKTADTEGSEWEKWVKQLQTKVADLERELDKTKLIVVQSKGTNGDLTAAMVLEQASKYDGLKAENQTLTVGVEWLKSKVKSLDNGAKSQIKKMESLKKAAGERKAGFGKVDKIATECMKAYSGDIACEQAIAKEAEAKYDAKCEEIDEVREELREMHQQLHIMQQDRDGGREELQQTRMQLYQVGLTAAGLDENLERVMQWRCEDGYNEFHPYT